MTAQNTGDALAEDHSRANTGNWFETIHRNISGRMTAIVLAALATTGAVSIVALQADPSPKKAALEPQPFRFGLTSPETGDVVTQEQQVSGTVAGLPARRSLWMFVVPAGNPPRYHPQVINVNIASNTWSGISYFGTATSGANSDYTLVVTRLTSAADAETRAYLDRYNKQNDYPGMANLPAGSERLVSILVRRN